MNNCYLPVYNLLQVCYKKTGLKEWRKNIIVKRYLKDGRTKLQVEQVDGAAKGK